MENKLLFTYDKDKYAGLPELVDELHARGQHYIIILVGTIDYQTDTDLKSLLFIVMPYVPVLCGKAVEK